MLNNMIDANALNTNNNNSSSNNAALEHSIETHVEPTTFEEQQHNKDSINANVTITTNCKTQKKTIFSWFQYSTTTTTTTNATNEQQQPQGDNLNNKSNNKTKVKATKQKRQNADNENSTETKPSAIINNDFQNSTQTTTTSSGDSATCTCDTPEASSKRTNLSRAKSHVADFTVGTLREFRGVQSLRHLWNKRISANESELKANHTNNNNSTRPGSKLNKSISCLLDATVQQDHEQKANNKTELLQRRAYTKRTHSLHNLNAIKSKDEYPEPISVVEEPQPNEPEIDSFHRVKDNFYKYKTAEQAARHLARETKARAKGRRSSAGIVGSCSFEERDAHFPAVDTSGERGERIHWAKRQDILTRRQRSKDEPRNSITTNNSLEDTMVINEIQSTVFAELNGSAEDSKVTAVNNKPKPPANCYHDDDMLISNASKKPKRDTPTDNANTPHSPSKVSPRRIMHHDKEEAAAYRPASAIPTTPQKTTSQQRLSDREGTTSLSKRDSADSASTTSTLSSGRTGVRRNGSSTSRKYSFKTHSHTRSYHLPRKMSGGANKDGHGSHAVNGSMVAKLTQQFNELIQKDKKLLDEVKRKNGVLMARNGHVYKVLPSIGERHKSANNSPPTASPLNLSRNNSHAKDSAGSSMVRSSMVQRNIKKFEKVVATTTEQTEKPEVPAKSAQVLKKRSELVSSKTHQSTGKRPQNGTPTMTTSQPLSKKPQLAALTPPTPLEVVKEEAKTPIEGETKTIITGDMQQTTELLTAPDTPPTMTEQQLPNTENVSMQASEQAAEEGAMEADLTADAADAVDASNNDKVKLRKHKYAMIYEKFRIRSPFKCAAAASATATKDANSKKESLAEQQKTSEEDKDKPKESQKTIESSSEAITTTETPHDAEKPTVPVLTVQPIAVTATAINATDVLLTTVTVNPEAKLLDALEAVDQKLKHLTLDASDEESMLLSNDNDDFEQRVLPNSSFVYQSTKKHTNSSQANSQKPLLVTQAVNVALVNAIEGEQMIMEQKELQQEQQKAKTEIQLQLQCETPPGGDEPLYEPIEAPSTEALKLSIVNEILQKPAEEEAAEEHEIKSLIVPTPQPSFVHCQANKSLENVSEPAVHIIELDAAPVEDIYQTLEDVRWSVFSRPAPPIPGSNKLDDYESIAGSAEATQQTQCTAPTQLSTYDGYEQFASAALDEPKTPTPSSKPVTPIPTTPITPVSRNTNDELPELPKPKRRLPKSPMPGKRPPKPKTLSPTAEEIKPLPMLPDDHHYYADDDENIYDTIKGSSVYESLPCAQLKKNETTVTTISNLAAAAAATTATTDNISLASNCYESIISYRRVVTSQAASVISSGCSNAAGSNSGSTLTISSDHKTNSLYEGSLAAVSLAYNARRRSTGSGTLSIVDVHSINGHHHHHHRQGSGSDTHSQQYSRHSIATSSDNSDEWVDISDAELDINNIAEPCAAIKQKFIVVRERFKKHNSPDWSKRVRDKRLNQKKSTSSMEEDSDHYYESLSPFGQKRQSLREIKRSHSHHKRNQDLPRYSLTGQQLVTGASTRSKKQSAAGNLHHISDDYDSFDTDTDEVYDTEESQRNQNDSGVDICHVKQLPEPPASTNQVYAIVKKIKCFISNKKTTTSNQKNQKLYENSSQFYVEGNVYENTPKAKVKHSKSLKKSSHKTISKKSDDIYENTDFHSPLTLGAAPEEAKQLSSSDKNISAHASNNDLPTQPPVATLRSKSKNGKSLRSRLRKSLVGSTFDSKTLSALQPTRSTFYVEDPSHCDTGELDSGFSEKASSGDLPTGAVTAPVTSDDAPNFCTVRKPKKEPKTDNAERRRTTIGIRPHEPPPPPPPVSSAQCKSKQLATAALTTSWYAECGVFKNSTANIGLDESSLNDSKSTISQNGSMANGNSWYAEAGLYQTSGASIASSSGSSGVSTGNEAVAGDDLPHSMFLNEPLYQIYSAAKLESISRDMEEHEGSTDGYEEIGQNGELKHDHLDDSSAISQKRARPTALQLIEPKNGPSRTLWSEISEVINSGILPTLTPRERALQEAKFEIITSEASYLKSLNLLRSHFMNNPSFRDTNILNSRDRKALFSYIVPVHECSERLLTELESCWQDNIMLLGLSKRIYDIAEKHFHVYIAFCEHQGRMDRTLRRLKESKGAFSTNLEMLESSPTCCGLNLHSFLMLPMQRITRLPLLIDAVFSKVMSNDDEYDNWKLTLAIMNKIVQQCNEAANRCEQAYEIERISRQLEFPTTIRALAIAPAGVPAAGAKPRFLVKKGELTHLIWRGDDAKLTFGKKFTKSLIYAFLFSDLLVLTKRKSEEQFQVFDYCPRNMLTISSGHLLPQLPTKDMGSSGKHLILMTLLENHERKTVELVLSCPSISEQERWLQAMRPPEAETPGEKLYEPWDCPQVIVKHSYISSEPDVLNLDVGDVINVARKLPDGWYQGERIRDSAVGWFPGSYTEEVNSAHVRARNLKQRYRLLTFTATYLESQKRK